MDEKKVASRDDLIAHLFDLLDDYDAVGDTWENQDVYRFLQAMAAWLNSCEGYYRNCHTTIDVEKATWQLFADALSAARVYG